MSCQIEDAVKYLKEKGIEAIDGGNILVIPFNYIEKCFSADDMANFVNTIKHYLHDAGYEKSWQINPYYYANKESLTHDMYG